MQRKKGIHRFFEILFNELRGLIKLNLLFLACVLPSAVIFLFGLFGFYSEIALVVSLMAAFPIGGAIVSYVFCITRMFRDESGYIWEDFKRKFKENIRQAALPGILCAAFVYAQVYLWGSFLFGGEGVDAVWIIPGVGFLLVFGMVTPYFFLQIAYIDLNTKKIVINSLLLSFANALRSVIGAVIGGAVWVAYILFMPESFVVTPILLIIGFSFSWLLNLMWVWPPVNKQFKIEEVLRERNHGRTGDRDGA